MSKTKLKISIIIPTFNSEKYIRDTLSSIISQGYSPLEIIVKDGGSVDQTISIVKSFNQKSVKIISKKDKGQYDAINQGMSYATGDIFCWLNSDDIYLPYTLKLVNDIFSKFDKVSWIIGLNTFINSESILYKMANNHVVYPQKLIRNGFYQDKCLGFLQQESMFWRKKVWDKTNGLRTSIDLAADFDLWLNFSKKFKLYSVNVPLASFRIHDTNRSKININSYRGEVRMILKEKLNPLLMIFTYNYLIRLLSIFIICRGDVIIVTNQKIKKLRTYRRLFKYNLI